MGLEVPCTLNPRRSAGCPDCARSKSEGYAGGIPAGQTKSAQPLHDRTRPTPFSGKGAGSTRFPPTDHQKVPGKPLSVKWLYILFGGFAKINLILALADNCTTNTSVSTLVCFACLVTSTIALCCMYSKFRMKTVGSRVSRVIPTMSILTVTSFVMTACYTMLALPSILILDGYEM